MTVSKQIWLLAGGNGAGKSTFYLLFLAPRGIKLLNANLIAKEINPENPEKVSYEAANFVGRLLEDFLFQGISFCYETVFSHRSKIDFVAKAKAQGYKIILVYIHLDQFLLGWQPPVGSLAPPVGLAQPGAQAQDQVACVSHLIY